MSANPAAVDVERPVFLLAPTWRCGSTLLQRLLSSSDALFVWGETEAMLHRLRDVTSPTPAFAKTQKLHRKEFAKRGVAGWIPNLSPAGDAEIDAMRAYLTAYYAAATGQLGRRRWGLKEVRYDAEDARLLLTLFPRGRVVFLLRHPVDVMSSIARVRWPAGSASPEEAAADWARRTPGMLETEDERCLVARHEELVGDPDTELTRICEHIGIDGDALDRGLLNQRVGSSPGRPVPSPRLQELAQAPDLRRAAVAAGYDIGSHPLIAAPPAARWGRRRG